MTLARRRLPERQRRSAGVPRQLGDGVRQLRLLVERRAAHVAGGPPARPDDAGRRVAAGRSGHDAGRRRLRRRLADRQRRSTRTARSAPAWEGTFFAADAGRNEVFSYQPTRARRGLRARPQDLPDLEHGAEVRRLRLRRRQRQRDGRGRDAVPSVRRRGRPRRRASTSATGSTRASAATRISTTTTVRRDLPDRAEGLRLAGRRRSTPATIDGQITALRSPAVNVRAIGFNGLKARGAAAVDAGRGAAERSEPVHPRPRDLPAVSARPRGAEARRHAGVADRSGDAHRGLPRDAPRRPRRPAGRRASWRKDADAGVRREVALSLRDQPADEVARPSSSSIARGYDGQDRSYLEALGTGATGKEAGALRSAARASSACNDDPVAWSPTFAWIAWRLHVPAAVAGSAGARALGEAVRSPIASSRSTRSRSSRIRPRRRRCSRSPAPNSPLQRAGDVVAAEPDVEQLVGPRPAPGAEDGRHLRSRRDRARRRRSCPRPPTTCPTLSIDEIVELTGDAAAARTTVDALPDVPLDRRHRRRARPGARRLGPRQVGRRDRHRDRQPERRDRARLRRRASCETKDGLTIQGVLIKEGDPLMMRSMGGITQIIPADRVAPRRRHARSR